MTISQTGPGGRRPGAGRPPGSKNRKSSAIAREAMEAGITPVEVRLNAMRGWWEGGASEAKREAVRIAKDAEPYVHPRLACIDQTIHEPQQYVIYVPQPYLTSEEWQAHKRSSTSCPGSMTSYDRTQRERQSEPGA